MVWNTWKLTGSRCSSEISHGLTKRYQNIIAAPGYSRFSESIISPLTKISLSCATSHSKVWKYSLIIENSVLCGEYLLRVLFTHMHLSCPSRIYSVFVPIFVLMASMQDPKFTLFWRYTSGMINVDWWVTPTNVELLWSLIMLFFSYISSLSVSAIGKWYLKICLLSFWWFVLWCL